MTLHAQKDENGMQLGYFLDDNNTVFDLPSCPLVKEEINLLYTEAREKPGFKHTLKDGMNLVFRAAAYNEPLFWRNNPPRNQSWLKEKTAIGDLSVPADSFFQVNSDCADLLLTEVQQLVTDRAPAQILDLFCGAGGFSIAAAQATPCAVIGVDNNEPAIQAARYNAKNHQLTNCEFRITDVNRNFSVFDDVSPSETLLITDPPRSGMSQRLSRRIGASGIADIIYISCAPDTLARDLNILLQLGYELKSTQLVDMFPRTAHFESISVLQHKGT